MFGPLFGFTLGSGSTAPHGNQGQGAPYQDSGGKDDPYGLQWLLFDGMLRILKHVFSSVAAALDGPERSADAIFDRFSDLRLDSGDFAKSLLGRSRFLQ
jgi:hypothetical protein